MAAPAEPTAATTMVTAVFCGPSTGEQTLKIAADLTKPSPPEQMDLASGIYSFEYTGKHDGGELPSVSDNYYNHLVAALREAKVKTDALIVASLDKEKAGGAAGAKQAGEAPSSKRSKSGEEDEEGGQQGAAGKS